jgi:hypothetical protein
MHKWGENKLTMISALESFRRFQEERLFLVYIQNDPNNP